MVNDQSGLTNMGGNTKNWDARFLEVSAQSVDLDALKFSQNLTKVQRGGLKELLKNKEGKKVFAKFLEGIATGLSFWLSPKNLDKLKGDSKKVEEDISSKYTNLTGTKKFINKLVSTDSIGKAATMRQFQKAQENILSLMCLDLYPRFLKSKDFEKLKGTSAYTEQEKYLKHDFTIATPLQWLLRFSEVSEKIYESVCISDPTLEDCPIVYVNKAFYATTGYSRDEVLGRNCRFLQGPETATAVKESIRNEIEDNNETRAKILNYRKNGQKFHNLLSMKPVCLNDETDSRFVVAIQFDLSMKRTPLEIFQLGTCIDLIPDRLQVKVNNSIVDETDDPSLAEVKPEPAPAAPTPTPAAAAPPAPLGELNPRDRAGSMPFSHAANQGAGMPSAMQPMDSPGIPPMGQNSFPPQANMQMDPANNMMLLNQIASVVSKQVANQMQGFMGEMKKGGGGGLDPNTAVTVAQNVARQCFANSPTCEDDVNRFVQAYAAALPAQ